MVGGFVMMMGRKKGEARRARETMVRKEAPSEVGKVVQARTLRERRMDLPLSTKTISNMMIFF